MAEQTSFFRRPVLIGVAILLWRRFGRFAGLEERPDRR